MFGSESRPCISVTDGRERGPTECKKAGEDLPCRVEVGETFGSYLDAGVFVGNFDDVDKEAEEERERVEDECEEEEEGEISQFEHGVHCGLEQFRGAHGMGTHGWIELCLNGCDSCFKVTALNGLQ